MTSQINDIIKIFNAFRDNDDFYLEIIKEALNTRKYEEAKKITKARDEFHNNYKISDETTELIKTNYEKYINIINNLKEKTDSFISSNDTYNIDINSEKIDNDTLIMSQKINEKESNETYDTSFSNINEEKDNNGNEHNNTNEKDDSNYRYSSKIAKDNLEKELDQVNNQIKAIRDSIKNSSKLPNKKEYISLFQLESYRDKLKNKLKKLNLEESYNNSNRIINKDEKLDMINNKIKEKENLMNSDISKFKKNRIGKRIEKLKIIQGKIESKQRLLVNKNLIKYYKESYKISKSESKKDARNKYYQDKLDLLQEKKDEILDKLDNNDTILAHIKNSLIKYRSWPTSIRISYVDRLQKLQNLGNIKGKINGFNILNKNIANKLYPIKQNIKERIDNLKQQKQNLINLEGMQEIINNLDQNIPELESTSMTRH